MLEADLQDIIENKKKNYTFEDTKSDFCDYGKLFKKLIRILLNEEKKENANLLMDWEERGLFAMNLDYLWRSILFAQDKIFTYNEDTLKDKINKIESDYFEKFNRMEKELKEKDKKLKECERKFRNEAIEMVNKFENEKQEKYRITKIAEDRFFELKCIRNETDVIALKTYYRDLDENMTLAITEK